QPRQQGFICTISSWGSLAPIFGVAYSVGKAACDRLAAEMARELKPHGITSLSLWPGIVGTEHISQIFDESQQELDSGQGLEFQQGLPNTTTVDRPSTAMIRDRYNWETPLLTGRVIAALAADPNLMRRSGRVNIVAELAKTYGVVDDKGNVPASLRSLRFLLPSAIPALQTHAHWIPDLRLPWWLMLLAALPSPKATNG
ncbi:MAG: SDR family NAD(P)-dependent oxidoreductase, partial [Symploca sp. SIO2B6]|nr:SDR family NAD(P)-dependent oxidoreductase [Symploca sp. SIO2B6]